MLDFLLVFAMKRVSDVTLSDVRACFDALMEKYADFGRQHLSVNSTIVKQKDFENAVVNIQRGQEESLTACEKLTVQDFELDDDIPCVLPDVSMSFAERAIKRQKSDSTSSRYSNLNYIPPTSNLCERFFSRCKYVFNDYRKRILPINLERQMFLMVNKSYWNIDTVSKVMLSANEDPTE
jgi:hypothetical protein